MAMQFSVTGKQMDVGDALKVHIEGTLNALVSKYFGGAIESHAVVSRERHLYRCDLSVHIGRGLLIQASETEADPYLAADNAANRIATRMRRYKRRLKDHHNGQTHQLQKASQAQYRVLAQEPDEEDEIDSGIDPQDGQPAVVAEMTTEIPTLTVGEAVMRLDLADQSTLMFKNSAHGGFNVVYRRKDGHIGWIDPREAAVRPT